MLFRSPRHLACIGSFHIVHSLAALYKQKKWLAPVSLYINTCFLRNHCRKLLSKVCTVCRHEIYAALTLFDISKQQIVRRNHVLARTTPACVCINNYDESGSENYSHVSHRQLLCKSIGGYILTGTRHNYLLFSFGPAITISSHCSALSNGINVASFFAIFQKRLR